MDLSEIFGRIAEPGGQLDQSLGVDAPDMPAEDPVESYHTNYWQRLLEGLRGAQPVQGPAGSETAFLGGLESGLGAAGSRVSAAQKEFEVSHATRRKLIDQERRDASIQTRRERMAALGGIQKRTQDQQDEVAKEEAKKIPIDDPMIANQPKLAPYKGQNLTKDRIDLITAETPAEKSKRVAAEKKAEADAQPQDEPLSDAAINTLVDIRLAGGPDPSFGMGKAGVRNKTRYYEGLAKSGVSGADIVANTAQRAADQGNLTNLTKQMGTMEAAERTLSGTTSVLRNTIKKVPDTGSPFLNSFVRPGMEKLFGSKDVSNFNTALGTVQKEFARILYSGTAGNQQLTDSQAADLRASLGPNFTKAQLLGALNIYDMDKGFRLKAQRAEIADTHRRLQLNGRRGAPPPPNRDQTQAEYDSIYGGPH